MNWYKIAQEFAPIAILSYNQYGELGISFNGGQKYTYPDVSPFIYDKIKFLLSKKNYRAVQGMLKNISANNKKELLPETEETKKAIIQELIEKGILSP